MISRRQFGQQLLGSLVFIGLGPGLTSLISRATQTDSLTPGSALQQLMAGHQRFLSQQRLLPHQDLNSVHTIAQAQAPFAAILSCADARVVPEIIFDQGLGDLFVARVAGNIAIPEEIASEEYAALVLQIPLIMVLGHSRCGAVAAAVAGKPWPGAMSSLVAAIQPAIQDVNNQPGDFLTNVIQANVHRQVAQLKQSPVLAARIAQHQLKIIPAYYDLDRGRVSLLPEAD